MKKLLVVVDYQNDFVNGALGFDGAEKIDQAIAEKIRKYAADPDADIIYTLDTHDEGYLNTREGKNLPVVHCIKGTHGWEYYGETKKALDASGAKGVEKYSFGLKITHENRKLLPENVDEIELAGIISNICVLSNAVIFQTRYPNAQLYIAPACTASNEPDLNEKVLELMEKGLQIKILR
ncbi:MAG: cysteine hydrolase family protein [Huintestinicola sp.]